MATHDQMVIWLDEAENALHQLMMGGQARVFVDQNGERIEYTAASRTGLVAYINSLRQALGLAAPSRPLTPWW